MQTITMLELKLEEAELACETWRRKLRGKWLAKFFLPEYVVYFEQKLKELLELIDDTFGLIATSERPLQRTEMLSRALMENGVRVQPISLIQTVSNQGEIAHELFGIWQADEEKMIGIEDNLFDFNQLLRELQDVREQASTKKLMDWLGFPDVESLPETISLRLMKDLLDPDVQSQTKQPVIQVQTKRMARQNSSESAWPSQDRHQGR